MRPGLQVEAQFQNGWKFSLCAGPAVFQICPTVGGVGTVSFPRLLYTSDLLTACQPLSAGGEREQALLLFGKCFWFKPSVTQALSSLLHILQTVSSWTLR